MSVAGPAVVVAAAEDGGIRKDVVPDMLVSTTGDIDYSNLSIMRPLVARMSYAENHSVWFSS